MMRNPVHPDHGVTLVSGQKTHRPAVETFWCLELWPWPIATASVGKRNCTPLLEDHSYLSSVLPYVVSVSYSLNMSSLYHKHKTTSHSRNPDPCWCSLLWIELWVVFIHLFLLTLCLMLQTLFLDHPVSHSSGVFGVILFDLTAVGPCSFSFFCLLKHHALGHYSQNSSYFSPVPTLPSTSSLIE